MNKANDEAEAAVLGAVIVQGCLFSQLEVTEEHFQSDTHKDIYRAMKKAQQQGLAIDMVTITTMLGEKINHTGGTGYLLGLAEAIASTESIAHYERLVLEAYRNKVSSDMVKSYYDHPSEEGLDQLIGQLKDFQVTGTSKKEKNTYDYLLEVTEEMCAPSTGNTGHLSSYHDLDDMTGGFQPGELIVIAARPSVGKTAFALTIAANHCHNQGSSSLFSLEMGTKQLLQRMISAEGQIYNQKWRSMAFSHKDYAFAIEAVGRISTWKLHVHEQKRTIADIRKALRKTVANHPEQKHLAIIDYLQLITPTGKKDRRDLEVGEMTRELKLLAMELHIPIILLSQLSRGVEHRNDKRPLMSDLRESGNIEQDADLIAFLYREDYYDKETERANEMEIIIAKQRNGPTGTVKLLFHREFGKFTEQGKRASAV